MSSACRPRRRASTCSSCPCTGPSGTCRTGCCTRSTLTPALSSRERFVFFSRSYGGVRDVGRDGKPVGALCSAAIRDVARGQRARLGHVRGAGSLRAALVPRALQARLHGRAHALPLWQDPPPEPLGAAVPAAELAVGRGRVPAAAAGDGQAAAVRLGRRAGRGGDACHRRPVLLLEPPHAARRAVVVAQRARAAPRDQRADGACDQLHPPARDGPRQRRHVPCRADRAPAPAHAAHLHLCAHGPGRGQPLGLGVPVLVRPRRGVGGAATVRLTCASPRPWQLIPFHAPTSFHDLHHYYSGYAGKAKNLATTFTIWDQLFGTYSARSVAAVKAKST
eukprot:Unigene7097_Nuclearia_a/m.21746 Unigene7097_Nuclearia_a/g.21746  ORF Unigene7097_Nuclearia_a/g.21746 Unigene7097_Nuclearia_a/m.21746 type:complete len:336 (-) Unigene7097_Nuclearia_a:23-1030(-)